MKSPRILTDKYRKSDKGFTLIEILIVMSIIVIFGGLGLFYGLDNLQRNSFSSERDILISTLQRARAESIANICYGDSCIEGESHGVYIDENNKRYVIFQGDNYLEGDPSNFEIKMNYNNVDFSEGVNEIVFERLSGNILYPDDIIIKDPTTGQKSIISTNSEGQISWKE